MARKKKRTSRRRGGEIETIGQRVAIYLDELFDGNKSRMAKFLGCSHTAVSSVAAGRQEPRHAFLASLAGHERVNVQWLISGLGDPFRPAGEDSHSGGWPIKIADQLLPGPPEKHKELLTMESHLVIKDLFRRTRYFYRVPKDSELVKDLHQGVHANDLILFETDRRLITEEELCLAPSGWGRLCVVLFKSHEMPEEQLCLGNVSVHWGDHESPTTYEFFPFMAGLRRSPDAKRITIIVDPNYAPEMTSEKLRRIPQKGSRRTPRYTLLRPTVPLYSVELTKIVAMGVTLVRPWLGG